VSSVKSNVIRDFRWVKGNLQAYYVHTGSILGCLRHDFCCDSFAGLCDDVEHKVDIEIYYAETVHELYTAACKCIPRVPRSALKHYWSAALDHCMHGSAMQVVIGHTAFKGEMANFDLSYLRHR
jgi:hypothetical protein